MQRLLHIGSVAFTNMGWAPAGEKVAAYHQVSEAEGNQRMRFDCLINKEGSEVRKERRDWAGDTIR